MHQNMKATKCDASAGSCACSSPSKELFEPLSSSCCPWAFTIHNLGSGESLPLRLSAGVLIKATWHRSSELFNTLWLDKLFYHNANSLIYCIESFKMRMVAKVADAVAPSCEYRIIRTQWVWRPSSGMYYDSNLTGQFHNCNNPEQTPCLQVANFTGRVAQLGSNNTILVPTNTAISAIGSGAALSAVQNPALLQQVLLFLFASFGPPGKARETPWILSAHCDWDESVHLHNSAQLLIDLSKSCIPSS